MQLCVIFRVATVRAYLRHRRAAGRHQAAAAAAAAAAEWAEPAGPAAAEWAESAAAPTDLKVARR